MRKVALVFLVLALGCGKKGGERAVPTAATTPILYASLATDDGARIVAPKRLFVDGLPISGDWTRDKPVAHTLGERGHLLEEHGECFVVPKNSTDIWPLGKCELVTVPRKGTLIERQGYGGSWELFHVDMRGPSLERLFIASPTADRSVQCHVAGVHRDVPLVLCRNYDRNGNADPHLRVVHVYGPGHVEEKSLALDPDMVSRTLDGVRGDRLIVVSREPVDAKIEIGIVDLESGARRRLGFAPQTFTRWTSIPHPCTSVTWRDNGIWPMEPRDEGCSRVMIEPATEALDVRKGA
jgi:hypothetical protein